MANSPESITRQSASNESESSTGFRSFWRKSDRSSATPNVQFVPQDPSNKRKTSRFGRLIRQQSSVSEGGQSESSDKTGTAAKRRQQVYQAQKRHRNRKAEYVQSLEAEVARLQHFDALINSEKNNIAHQNEALRSILATHSVDTQLDAMTLGTSSAGEDLSMLGSAAIDIRYDEQIDHERVFMDFDDLPDMVWTSSDTSQAGDVPEPPKRPTRDTPVKGDSWAALDFILALEWPCRDHIKHPGINPNATVPKACDVGGFHGHALTATNAVYQSALPPSSVTPELAEVSESGVPMQNGLHPSTAHTWQLPHSEIDKLVELSELLQLDDEQLTPAMAYSAIRQEVPNDGALRPVLNALKVPLSSMVQCSGFGAWMPADMFYQHLDGAIRELDRTLPTA